jgi:predicted ATPase
MERKFEILKHGATWLRADFHLHTNKDKEFQYSDDENEFIKKYIDRLKEEQIHVGLIANHHKFDSGQFKALWTKALKEEIYLLPGIEFSIKDGGRGIHLLIAFDDDWFNNKENNNYIQSFLDNAFYGIQHYNIPPYPNSKYDLADTVEKLDEIGKDYFIIMAHIDENNGMCVELTGRNFENFVQQPGFKKSVLALQKCRNQNQLKRLKQLIPPGDFPALVEGSDCKHLNEVGKAHQIHHDTKKTFIKLGEYNFEAIKFALRNHRYRVTNNHIPESKNTFIKSMRFIPGSAGNFNGELYFNQNANNFIGIRGSGKSSIVEVIRYVLGKHPYQDEKYKNLLIERTLGSGGKVEMRICCKTGVEYQISKILGEKEVISQDENYLDNVTIEKLLENDKIVYFGQKDLSYRNEDFNERLFQSLIGEKLQDIQKRISEKQAEIKQTLFELDKHKDLKEKLNEFIEEKSTLEHKLALFKEKEIDKKLEKQVNFKKDLAQIAETEKWINQLINDLKELVDKHEHEFDYHRKYESKENQAIFQLIAEEINQLERFFDSLKQTMEKFRLSGEKIKEQKIKLTKKYDELLEEFARIKREINEPALKADDFINFSDRLRIVELKINEARKGIEKRDFYKKQLTKQLKELKDLWHEEFKIWSNEAEKINSQNLSIKIFVKFKENKDKFDEFLKAMLKGQNIVEVNRRKITKQYNDCIEIYQDLENNSGEIFNILSGGNQFINFRDRFYSNLFDFLIYRPEDKIIITYKDKDLKYHSAGQRASAIILFLLTQEENDIVIIDQPEDDLDNQSIYEEVIKVLLQLKNKTQFIFATHSPNIVVLGDSEQIFSCNYSEDKISISQGGIDSIEMQKTIISVMEGGQDAFNKRREIYGLWKH